MLELVTSSNRTGNTRFQPAVAPFAFKKNKNIRVWKCVYSIYICTVRKRKRGLDGAGGGGRDLIKCLSHAAACNFIYLNAVSTEMLTGPCAVQKVVSSTLSNQGSCSPTIVNMKVSLKGITLTDINRK